MRSPKFRLYTEAEWKLSHKGRQICEAHELGAGYCGSIDYEGHVRQLCNPDSWVHSSVEDWLFAGRRGHSPRDTSSSLTRAEKLLRRVYDCQCAAKKYKGLHDEIAGFLGLPPN